MIDKVLRKNISLVQIAGYALAALVGLSIITVAVQFYCDISAALGGRRDTSTLIDNTNIVISKTVGLKDTFSGEAPSFSEAEVDALLAKPWVRAVTPFTAADFAVRAAVRLGDRGMSTALFFESLPDSLMDVAPADWAFDPARPLIPVVIPKDYLTLYNFGFAASGGMPTVSEGMLTRIPVMVTLSGNGLAETLPARIVGFSDWINTIAVPQAFMDWARQRYGSGAAAASRRPSRLVVEVSDPSNPDVMAYMEARGYEVAGRNSDISRASRFLTIISSVVILIGLIITLLALGILVLSLYLLVQKTRRSIATLVMLGYRPRAIAMRYVRLMAWVNVGVLGLSLAALFIVRRLWETPLAEIDIHPASPLVPVIASVAVMAVVTAVNVLTIFRLVSNTVARKR